jgi:hypothetical protein
MHASAPGLCASAKRYPAAIAGTGVAAEIFRLYHCE